MICSVLGPHRRLFRPSRMVMFPSLPEADMGCHPADPSAGAPSEIHNISFCCGSAALRGYPVMFSCNSRYLKGIAFLDIFGFNFLSIR